MIKAVIFDVDGVLLDSFEANLKFFTDLLTKFGHRPPTREEFSKFTAHHMMGFIRDFSKIKSEEEIQKIWLAGKEHKVPYPYDLLDIPDALEETIKVLHKNFSLGIVTSRANTVFEVSQLAPLKKYFKVLVLYGDTDKHKPDPEPLLLAAKKLKIKPEECVYVGDTESDLIATRAAGMKAIIFSKDKFKDAHAGTAIFSELPKIIETFQ